MHCRIYLRASTVEQDAERAKATLEQFAKDKGLIVIHEYIENHTGTKLDRPELNRLLDECKEGEILLVESVDRLSRLSMDDWEQLKSIINSKGLKLVVVDLPTTHSLLNSDDLTLSILKIINNMLLDLMANMARIDNEKRKERILQGQARAKAQGKIIGGSNKNQEIRDKIQSYENLNLTAQEVAKLVGCGVATVYRTRKELSN